MWKNRNPAEVLAAEGLVERKGRTMQARTWWIDEPLAIAASNPAGEDLAELRAEGFSVIVCRPGQSVGMLT